MRKIALVGTGESGHEAPFEDPSWEIWGVASRFKYVTRAERWFELHRLSGESPSFQAHWRRDIKQWSAGVELWMMYPEPDLGPKVIPFPHAHIVARFGTYFMTSSFAWMMALAIDELRPVVGPETEGAIGLWGVDMEYGTEYRQQRAGFRHFLDLCRYARINVTRFADSGLSFEPVPYPMWQDDPLLAKVEKRRNESRAQVESLQQSLRHTRTMIAQNRMAIEELQKLPKAEPESERQILRRMQALKKEHDALVDTSSTISRELVVAEATEAEQSYWWDYIQP